MKKINKVEIILLILISFCYSASNCQSNSYYKNIPLSLNRFLEGVSKGNLGYIAGQLDVSISQAGVEAAKVFPDPEISLSYTNNEDKKLMLGQSVEGTINYNLNLGNKRGAGISFANSQYDLAKILLNSYFQNLRADAAIAYFIALRNKKLYVLQNEISDQLKKLARVDSLRLLAGDVNSLDAMQSALEAKTSLSEVYQSGADFHNTCIDLVRLQGKTMKDTLIDPSDDFPAKISDFGIADLVQKALANRADLMAAIKNREVSEKYLRLIKANRAFEINLEAGYAYNSEAKSDIAPVPEYNAITAGIGIPLKFSSLNRGEVKVAEMMVNQKEIMKNEIENQIITEVFKAYNNYIVLKQKAALFRTDIIEDAEKILQGRIYSYQHGETGVFDVLSSQKSYAELRKTYIEVQFEYTVALIDLERYSGIWDIGL